MHSGKEEVYSGDSCSEYGADAKLLGTADLWSGRWHLNFPEDTGMTLENVLFVGTHAFHLLLLLVFDACEDTPLDPKLVFLTSFKRQCIITTDVEGSDELDGRSSSFLVEGATCNCESNFVR